MADVASADDRVGQPADGDRPATGRELVEEAHCLEYFGFRRPAVRPRLPRLVRMRRHDIPKEDVLLEPELGEHAMDDRGRRLRRALARELALGRERQPANPRPAVPGRLPDEQVPRLRAPVQIGLEPGAAKPRAGVLIEGRPDPGAGELLDERARFQASLPRR